MNNQDIALGILIMLFLIVAVYFLTRQSPKEPRYEFAEQVDGNDSSKKINLLEKEIDLLEKEIKLLEKEDAKLRSQMDLLNLQAGIHNEQTKYLTANVNRTVYPA